MNKNKKNRLIKILDSFKNYEIIEIDKFSRNLEVSISTIEKDIFLLKKYLPIEFRGGYIIDIGYDSKSKLDDLEKIATWLLTEDDPYSQFQLTNLKKSIYDIEYLPNKNTLQYTQIKNFKDYELTYCIVHEMIIRNKKVIKLLKIFHRILTTQDKKYEEYINFKNCDIKEKFYNRHKYYKKYINNFNEFKEMIEKEVEKKIYRRKSLIDKIENILKNDYMISPFDGNFNNDYYYYGKKYLTYNYDMTNDIEGDYKNIVKHQYKINTNEFEPQRLSFNGTIQREGFNLRQAIYKGENNFQYSFIEPNFYRNINDSNLTNLSINLSLPKNELLAYISHIKDTLFPDKIKNKKLMTPEELQRDQIYEKNFIKLKKETIVDHFFVYDFVNACRTYLKKHSKKTIKDAKNEERKRFLEDYELYIIDDIFKHKILKKQIHLDRETVKNYYYKMYDFIEKLKYKELINSAFVKTKVKNDGRSLNKEEQQKKRDEVFRIFDSVKKSDLFDKDKTNINNIAKVVGVSKSRIYAWRKVYANLKKDSEQLQYKIKSRGRPKTKSLDKEEFLTLLMSKHQIWDNEKIKSLLQQQNIEMSISTINNYLKKFNIYFKDDIYFDGIKVKTIKKYIDLYFPNLYKQAKIDNAVIYWTDANSNKYIDISKNKTFHIKNIISYSHNKFMFSLYSKNTNDELLDFLDKLINSSEKKIYLIIDDFNKNLIPEVLTFEEKNRHKIQII